MSTLSYAPTPGQRSRTCSVLSTGDVLGSAALAAAALLPDVAAAAALATKEVAVYRVMMLGGPGVGKTALTQQFVTSEYIAAQNTSFGQSLVVRLLIIRLSHRRRSNGCEYNHRKSLFTLISLRKI